jgi:hypothetical protein
MARTFNREHCRPMQDDDLVIHAAESAWRYEERNLNYVGGGCVVGSHAEIEDLAARSPDALALLLKLRRHHWEKTEFVVANAMAPSLGWTLPRFRAARRTLVEGSYLVCITPGGRGQNDPPRFGWPRRGTKSYPNRNIHPLSVLPLPSLPKKYLPREPRLYRAKRATDGRAQTSGRKHGVVHVGRDRAVGKADA